MGVVINYKTHSFGTYSTKEQAKEIARKLEKEIYGDFTPME